MSLVVDTHKLGVKLHRLEIKFDGQLLGEYERAQEADIHRKKEEVQCALALLLRMFKEHGEFKVRWNRARNEKVIFANNIEVGVIPKSCWRTPSWKK